MAMMLSLLFTTLALFRISSSAPYNCSIFTGVNVTWMQMLDDLTVLGGYSYYWANGTLHNYDLEDNLITIGNYTIINDVDADLCYEKEQYDYTLNIPATCNSFYITEAKGEGAGFITQQGCLQFGNNCTFTKTCDARWKNWWAAKFTNYL